MVKQTFVGTVISAIKEECKVRVERHVVHPKVHKLVPFHKSFICDNSNVDAKAKLGDIVRIQQIQPLSKIKYFAVQNIVLHGTRITDPVDGVHERVYIPDGMIKDYSKFSYRPPTKKKLRAFAKNKKN